MWVEIDTNKWQGNEQKMKKKNNNKTKTLENDRERGRRTRRLLKWMRMRHRMKWKCVWPTANFEWHTVNGVMKTTTTANWWWTGAYTFGGPSTHWKKSIEQIMTLNYSLNSFMKHGHLRLMNALYTFSSAAFFPSVSQSDGVFFGILWHSKIVRTHMLNDRIHDWPQNVLQCTQLSVNI